MDDRNLAINNARIKPHDLGLYLHIPFCVRKCDYCDFLSAPANEAMHKKYLEALLIEIGSHHKLAKDYLVKTIFIGGGTPSCVKASYIEDIMNRVREVFHITETGLETTIEINPGTVTKEKLLIYKRAGINRISFGLQSTDNRELKLLGRIHSYEQLVDNYITARELGFDNINIDLMSALPGQTLSSWDTTLNQVISLKPEHISAYSLIIEEGTPFYESYGEGKKGESLLPKEEVDRAIYHRTKELLLTNCYERYEISNYALKGYECRHNSSYWTGVEYLGLGLGASSYLRLHRNTAESIEHTMQRFQVMDNLEEYISTCKDIQKKQMIYNTAMISNLNQNSSILMDLDRIGIHQGHMVIYRREQMEEFMYLGLRMCKGVNIDDFKDRFHKDIHEVYGSIIHRLIQGGLLARNNQWLQLTEYGTDVSNRVLSEFLIS